MLVKCNTNSSIINLWGLKRPNVDTSPSQDPAVLPLRLMYDTNALANIHAMHTGMCGMFAMGRRAAARRAEEMLRSVDASLERQLIAD